MPILGGSLRTHGLFFSGSLKQRYGLLTATHKRARVVSLLADNARESVRTCTGSGRRRRLASAPALVSVLSHTPYLVSPCPPHAPFFENLKTPPTRSGEVRSFMCEERDGQLVPPHARDRSAGLRPSTPNYPGASPISLLFFLFWISCCVFFRTRAREVRGLWNQTSRCLLLHWGCAHKHSSKINE